MTKQITISDDMAKRLDEIRQKYKCSFTEAIELYVKGYDQIDEKVKKINEFFDSIRDYTDPSVIDYLRVATINFVKGTDGKARRLLKELIEVGEKELAEKEKKERMERMKRVRK